MGTDQQQIPLTARDIPLGTIVRDERTGKIATVRDRSAAGGFVYVRDRAGFEWSVTLVVIR